MGADILSVCLKPHQFSCWWDGQAERVRTVTEGDPHFKRALRVARLCLAGTYSDTTGGADRYHARGIAPPFWAADATPSAEIGDHVFYRLGKDGRYRSPIVRPDMLGTPGRPRTTGPTPRRDAAGTPAVLERGAEDAATIERLRVKVKRLESGLDDIKSIYAGCAVVFGMHGSGIARAGRVAMDRITDLARSAVSGDP